MKELVRDLVKDDVLKSPNIIEAFLHVDRADFLPDEIKSLAYVNEPLSIGYGQTISQPWTVAFMLEKLSPGPGHVILDVGSGSGWQTTLLSYIVSHDKFGKDIEEGMWGHVVGLELVPELAKKGLANISKYNFLRKGIAEIHARNAVGGFPGKMPFDRIIAAAASFNIQEEWKDQLKVGGRIVAPVNSRIVLLEKIEDKTFKKESFEGFAFVPFIENDEGSYKA